MMTVMAQAQNPQAIAHGTGRAWEEWVRLLDEAGAAAMDHAAIAKLTYTHMPDQVTNRGWWAQGAAIAYEQQKGLRIPGQSSSGDFQASATKTHSGNRDAALQAWLSLVEDAEEFDGVAFSEEPAVSSTEKWHYWRVALSDGTRVSVNISGKPPTSTGIKSSVAANHTKLSDEATRERWRAFWKAMLADL